MRPRARGALVFAAPLAIGLACAAAPTPAPRAPADRYDPSATPPRELGAEELALRDVPALPDEIGPEAFADLERDDLRPFGGPERNGRTPGRLGVSPYKRAATQRLPAEARPSAILAPRTTWEAPIVLGAPALRFGDDGAPAKPAWPSAGVGLRDREHGELLLAGRSIEARRFEDGSATWALPFGGDPATQATQATAELLVRDDDRLVAVSTRAAGSGSASTSATTWVESWPLPARPAVDARGVVPLAPARFTLVGGADGVAMHGDVIALARRGQLLLVEVRGLAAPRLARALVGDFAPSAVSLDERGDVYLLVHTTGKAQDATSAWKLDHATLARRAQGDLDFAARLPPLVGFDHRVFVIGKARVVALSPATFERSFAGVVRESAAGAAVTPDGDLLISDGSELVRFDRSGARTVLQAFPGEVLTTPPTISADGRIWVATQTALYTLTPAAPPPMPIPRGASTSAASSKPTPLPSATASAKASGSASGSSSTTKPTPLPSAAATSSASSKPTPLPTAKPTPLPTTKPTPLPTAKPKPTPEPEPEPEPDPELDPGEWGEDD